MGGNGHDVPANAYRGEVRVTLGGGTYLLRLSMNVLAVLEEALEAHGEVPQRLLNAGYRCVRQTFHAALTTADRNGARQMPADTTLAEIGDLLDASGGLFKDSPVTHTYWALVVGAGFLDQEEAERIGLLPPGKADAGAAPAPVLAVVVDAVPTPAGT